MAYQTEDGNVVCEQCGNEYQRIGGHWGHPRVECSHPPLSALQKDVIVGALMGDGCIKAKRQENQCLQIDWTSEGACSWIDEALGWLSTGVGLTETAKEKCDRCGGERDGVSYSEDSADWSDQYAVRTRSHPFITEMTTQWYGESGYEDKEWPEELVLTPTILLLWYVSDGNYSDKGTNRRIRISLKNEIGNEEKVEQYFEIAGIPKPCRWDDGGSYNACWNLRESKALFEYMAQSPLMEDGAPDGFEYKFPEEYGGTGKPMEDVEPAETPQKALTAD